MKRCHYCATECESDYHQRCALKLFGATKAPVVDAELAQLHTLGLAMVGHTSLSGMQRKISVRLDGERATLKVAIDTGGQYLLKPQANTFPFLPENEHLTMRLAQLAGVQVAECGLIKLADDSVAYIVKRFDREEDGSKLHQEDFCQLAERAPKEKYQGSAELCVRLLRRYADEPTIEVLKLYRQFVVAWWTGNGDLPLKNLSLLRDPSSNLHRLSPAYDLLSTRLVIADDALALTVVGKRDALSKAAWLALAEYAGLPKRAALRALGEVADTRSEALRLIGDAMLPSEMQEQYSELIETRSNILGN